MKALIAIVILVLVAGAVATWFDAPGRFHAGGQTAAAPAVEAEAAFSPRGGCMRAIAREIGKAQTSVRIAARVLSAEAVVAAIADARKRGVKVEAVLDGRAGQASANALYDLGVAVYLDRQHDTLAGGTLVIDDATTIVSAVDLSDAAENAQAGSALIARSPAAAAKCAENWRVHLAHAESLETLPPAKSGDGAAPAQPAPSSSPFKTSHRQQDSTPRP